MNDQTLNIKFVQEVEKYPCLYNYTLTDYSRKDVTERAWNEVGKIFNLSHSQCKEKWKNLRAVFVRHTKPALSGSSSKNKKPYYLADAMQFTIPYIKALNNTISGNLPQVAVREVMEQEDNEEANDVDDGIMEYFKARKAKLDKKSEDIEDPKRMFLLSLLPDLKAMSESQTRTFKRRVLALVDEILDESPRTLAPQKAIPAYNFETQSVLLSTQGLTVSNEQRAINTNNNK